MPPIGMVPPARGGGMARGGQARPVKLPAPKAPAAVRVKPIDPNAQAQQNAMSAFRTALAQLHASTPAIDQNAIYAPYRASEAVTGQLGQGLQQAVLGSGQAAQTQYGAALDQAQQHAAQFGISAGAGANPTQLQNTGAAPLAAQTNAYAAAAPQAATAWQGLLERTAAAKVNSADLARAQGLTSAEQSLSATIPGAIQNEKTRIFQQKAQRFNEGLARTQLTDKQNAEMRQYGLGVAKVQQSGAVASTRASQTAASIAERTRHDRATEKAAQQKLQQGQVKLSAAQQKAAKGLTGVAAAVKALQPSTSKGGTVKAAKGFDVMIQPWDTANNKPSGPAVSKHLPRLDVTLPGYKVLKSTATTHYASVPASSTTSGATQSAWDAQFRSLQGANPKASAAQIRAALGPRPAK